MNYFIFETDETSPVKAFSNVKISDEFVELDADLIEYQGVPYASTSPIVRERVEELKREKALAEAKEHRAKAVAAIKVEVDSMVFDGDEAAQSRMARAITAAEAAGLDSTVWVLADNTVATVTKEQLQMALNKAMIEMSKLWVVPYEKSTLLDDRSR